MEGRERTSVPLYSFLYSGKCSSQTAQETFMNNSYIPSSRKISSNMPSERWIPARVFMYSKDGHEIMGSRCGDNKSDAPL